jgi:hypothetical protein
MSATPTLGCQIAPQYHRDALTDSGESSTEDEYDLAGTETEERGEREDVVNSTDLEKAETQRDGALTGVATRPAILQKGRTRSSPRVREDQRPPVGFWHWQMVRAVCIGF